MGAGPWRAPQYKLRLYSDRLNLLYQRLRRNKRFQPRAQGGDSEVGDRAARQLLALGHPAQVAPLPRPKTDDTPR